MLHLQIYKNIEMVLKAKEIAKKTRKKVRVRGFTEARFIGKF